MLADITLEQLKTGCVLLLDKPYKWTSFDAINFIKRPFHLKIGHCGTLDPLATGLLICCTGEMTKQISNYQKLPKEYTGIFHLGAVTPTRDLESEPVDFKPFDHVSEADISAAVSKLTGDIIQIPPAHSAVKRDGKRAYELARKGKDVELEGRAVTISEFEITEIKLPEVHFRVLCSTGTYIRSLAHDFGEILGCGAYLSALRRTRIGNFSVQDAGTPQQWTDFFRAQRDLNKAGSQLL